MASVCSRYNARSDWLSAAKRQGIIYGLLTKCEVKMAGYWPSSFFFCVFMDRDEVEVHKLAKKNEANIQPS